MQLAEWTVNLFLVFQERVQGLPQFWETFRNSNLVKCWFLNKIFIKMQCFLTVDCHVLDIGLFFEWTIIEWFSTHSRLHIELQSDNTSFNYWSKFYGFLSKFQAFVSLYFHTILCKAYRYGPLGTISQNVYVAFPKELPSFIHSSYVERSSFWNHLCDFYTQTGCIVCPVGSLQV